MGKYRSTKKYTHENGFSCAFRQWRADSHCHFIHGYALAFELTFESDTLDERNWVMDFGGLKEIKSWLTYMFDHTTMVAEDDPFLLLFKDLERYGLIDLRIVPAVGCERVAELVFSHVRDFVKENAPPGVELLSVQVWEHGANSASHFKS